MTPTNLKVLFHTLMESIDDLRAGKITHQAAREISNLGARMNTAFNLNQERARLQKELHEYAQKTGELIEIREIEGKNFE